MHREGGHRGRDRPQRHLQRLDAHAVLLEEALDEQDRADGDEHVLAEEQPDVVGRRGVGAHEPPLRLAERAEPRLRGPLGHGRDERPHHLRVPAERGEAERGGDLAEREVGEEHAPRRGRPQPRDAPARVLAQPRALEQADGGEHQPHGRDVAVLDERAAEGVEDGA